MHSVLVIDDDHDIRAALRTLLEGAGYFVFTAANGADGLYMLGGVEPPSLILLDLHMPILSGEGFLKAKAQNETLKSVPTVVMSSLASSIDPSVASVVISKPFDLEELLKIVRSYCADTVS